ncbi:hypothetical protein KAR91_87565 [Candidatus Pacearchaeota archaeon]|nr:hypothetical protein [Candidatus Pacearchaeota archaeon]
MSMGLSLWLDIFFGHLKKEGLSQQAALRVMVKLTAKYPANLAIVLEGVVDDWKQFIDAVEHDFYLQQFVDGEEEYQKHRKAAP